MIDRKTALDLLATLDYPGCNPDEITEYIQAHFERMYETFRVIDALHPTEHHTILDIGAKPYLLAALVKQFTNAQYIGVGYSIEEFRGAQNSKEIRNLASNTGPVPVRSADIPLTLVQSKESRQTTDDKRQTIRMYQCNVETSPLPFPDDSVDCVIFSEILEHLLFNPALIFAEMNRVLRTGGTVILSTPNQLSWVRLIKLLLGRNIDDPYSIHGPYGRHNRNYTPKEIRRLLELQGFRTAKWRTTTFLPLSAGPLQKFATAAGHALFTVIPSRRGNTFFGTFKKTSHKPEPQYPKWLYH